MECQTNGGTPTRKAFRGSSNVHLIVVATIIIILIFMATITVNDKFRLSHSPSHSDEWTHATNANRHERNGVLKMAPKDQRLLGGGAVATSLRNETKLLRRARVVLIRHSPLAIMSVNCRLWRACGWVGAVLMPDLVCHVWVLQGFMLQLVEANGVWEARGSRRCSYSR